MPGSGSGPYVVLTTCLPLGLRPRAGGAQGAWMPCGTPSSGSGPQQGCVPGGDGVCARDPIHGPSRSLQTGLAGALGHLPHSPMSPACRRLLEQVVSCSGLLPGAGLPEDQTVTWFQFHSYLQRQGVSDLEKHFAQLAKEGRGWGGGHRRQHGDDGPARRGALCLGSAKPVFQNPFPLHLFF